MIDRYRRQLAQCLGDPRQHNLARLVAEKAAMRNLRSEDTYERAADLARQLDVLAGLGLIVGYAVGIAKVKGGGTSQAGQLHAVLGEEPSDGRRIRGQLRT